VRWTLKVGRILCLVAVLGPLGGCALFNAGSLFKAETWNLDRFRDERARDIDSRLSENRPIVQNPF
jgi:hypothetical protein